MKNWKTMTKTLNVFVWLLGAIFLGETIIQIAYRLGLEIPTVDKYLTLQVITYLPIGAASYFLLKTKVSRYVTSMAAILSLYIVNFASMLVYSFSEPWTYAKENSEEVIKAFLQNVLPLLPLLIGYFAAALALRAARSYLEKRKNKQQIEESTVVEAEVVEEMKKTTPKKVKSTNRSKSKKNAGQKRRTSRKKAK